MIFKVLYAVFMFGGMFFFGVGTLGLIRMPDTFSRAHSAAKCDTLGAALCMMGLVLMDGLSFKDTKFLLVIAFIWLTNPTATHLIARSIYKNTSKGVNE